VTQSELNDCAAGEALAAEAELERAVASLRAIHSGRPVVLKALDVSQAA
jgi:hypothetical protein